MSFKKEQIEEALDALGFDDQRVDAEAILRDFWDIAFSEGENWGYDEGYNDGQAASESG